MFIIKIASIFAKVGELLMLFNERKRVRRHTIVARELIDNETTEQTSEKISKILVSRGEKTIVLDLDHALPSNRMRTIKATKLALESFIKKNPNSKMSDLNHVVVVRYRGNPAAGRLYKNMLMDQTLKGGQMIVDKESLKAAQKKATMD